jgi:hypothetical protein
MTIALIAAACWIGLNVLAVGAGGRWRKRRARERSRDHMVSHRRGPGLHSCCLRHRLGLRADPAVHRIQVEAAVLTMTAKVS